MSKEGLCKSMKDIPEDPTKSVLDVVIEKGFLSKFRMSFINIDFQENIEVKIKDKNIKLNKKMFFCYIAGEGVQPIKKHITKKEPSEFEWTVIEIIDSRLEELKGQAFFAISIWNLENCNEIAIVRYISLYKKKFTHLILNMAFEVISKNDLVLNIVSQVKTEIADFIGLTDVEKVNKKYEEAVFSILPDECILDAKDYVKNELIIQFQSNYALKIKAGSSKSILKIQNKNRDLKLFFSNSVRTSRQIHLPIITFILNLEPTGVRNSYIGVQMHKNDWITALAFLVSRLTPPEFEESIIHEKFRRVNQNSIPLLFFKENQQLIDHFPILYLFNCKDFNTTSDSSRLKVYELPILSEPNLKLSYIMKSIEKHLKESHDIEVMYDVLFLLPNKPILGLKCVSLIHYMNGYPIICEIGKDDYDVDFNKIKFKHVFAVEESISHPITKRLQKMKFKITPISRKKINIELAIQFFVDSLIDELVKIVLTWNRVSLRGVTVKNPIFMFILKEMAKLGIIQKFEQIMPKIRSKTTTFSDLNSLYSLFRNLNTISPFIPFLVEKVNSRFYQGRNVAGFPLKQTTISIIERNSSIENLVNAAYYSRAHHTYMIDLDFRVRKNKRLTSSLAAMKNDVINKIKITPNSKTLRNFWKTAKIQLIGSELEFIEQYFKNLPLFEYAMKHNLKLRTIGSELPHNYQNQTPFFYTSVFKGFLCVFSPRNALIELQIDKYFKFEFCTGRMGIKNSIVTNARILNNLIPSFKRKSIPRFMMINAVPENIPQKILGRVEEYIRNLGDVDFFVTEYSFSKPLVLKKIKEADFIIIWAHGNQQIINFKGWGLNYKEIREKIDNRTLILLNSCETGSKLNSTPSIIKTLLRNQNCIIIAPITPIYINDSLFFFEKFIRSITNNLPISAILRKIRIESQSSHPLCAFYSFHGDPLLTFFHFSLEKQKELDRKFIDQFSK